MLARVNVLFSHLPLSMAQTTVKTSDLFKASDYGDDGKHHLLLAASGSVATIKLPKIVGVLSKHKNISIRIIITASAEKFLIGQSEEQPRLDSLLDSRQVDGIYRDEDEWKKPWVRGDPILHIELRDWADMLVVAPLSANTLAKMSMGLTDNLLSSVIRAWETAGGIVDGVWNDAGVLIGGRRVQKRIIIAPAMNTHMWENPITQRQLMGLDGVITSIELDGEKPQINGESHKATLEAQAGWVEIVQPVVKELACGVYGKGAMAEWADIVKLVETRLKLGDNKLVSRSERQFPTNSV